MVLQAKTQAKIILLTWAPGGPTPRFGASMAVAKSGQLFLFGGMVEDGDKQITLNDFYCLGEPSYLELVWDFVFTRMRVWSESKNKVVLYRDTVSVEPGSRPFSDSVSVLKDTFMGVDRC